MNDKIMIAWLLIYRKKTWKEIYQDTISGYFWKTEVWVINFFFVLYIFSKFSSVIMYCISNLRKSLKIFSCEKQKQV